MWLRIKDTGRELGVKNICHLVDKGIKGKFETNYPTEQQIKKYKRPRLGLINDEKLMYAHECIKIPIIMHCKIPAALEFRSKLGFS